MGLFFTPDLNGRIVTKTFISYQSSLLNACHGMASTSFGQKLVCFYCNKKSGIKYDGTVTQWECSTCTAPNYLDENGDITDPPVATLIASPRDLRYSIARPDSPVSQTSSRGSDSAGFCSTCLKNQHLLIASLAQFHVETDPSHPEYKESEDKYFKYRRNLEKRYPQCCEDCQAMVLEQMKEAEKLGKSDFLRRELENSRRRRYALKGRFTLCDAIDFMGKFLWHIGLLGQLLWSVFTVAYIIEYHHETALDSSLPTFISTLLPTLLAASTYLPAGISLAFWGLVCTLCSLWWNPKFKNLNKGFMRHVTGYVEWYKHQFTLFGIRCLFFYVMAKEDFADTKPAFTGAAHAFIFVFITFLTIRSQRFIKVNMNKLWNSTPDKISFVGPSSSPKQSGNSLENALNEIGANTHRQSRFAFTPSPPTYRESFRPQPYESGSIRVSHDKTAPVQSLKTLNISSEYRGRKSPPLFSSTYTSASRSQSPQEQDASMDWSPSQPKSQHRAFIENLPVDKGAEFFGRIPIQRQPTKLFGQSPVVDSRATPFWFKVPPAPITPAHQLRNPPNQPRIRVTSQGEKENFFNNVTRRSLARKEPFETTEMTNIQRPGYEFAQQKFFAPSIPSAEHEVLADAMSSWTLSDPSRPEGFIEMKNTSRHTWQGIVLVIAAVGVGFVYTRNDLIKDLAELCDLSSWINSWNY